MLKQLVTSRMIQAAWLLFALISVSLALSDIESYSKVIEQACLGTACPPGQLTSLR